MEVAEVVHPALGDEEAAAGALLAVGDDGAVVLVLGRGVAGAVDVPREVEAVLVDPGDGLAGHGHVALDGRAELVLGLPAQALAVGVDPDEQLLLRGLGDLAVRGLVAGVGLEVLGDVVGQLREQRRARRRGRG